MTDTAIDIQNASKIYKGKIHALRGVDLRVGRGEVFGLLGPNGAGKSTLVKILMTVIRPSSVSGTLLGQPVAEKKTLAKVGYLPEHHRFPQYLKGRQVLDFYGAMAGVPRRERKRRASGLLELVGMTDWAGKRIKQYSKGMRQRIGIAQALMNDPELVLLDEPTDGVDPSGRRDIRLICQRLREEGRTLFINSHLLSELEMVCDRVAIMVKGRVASQGTIDELTVGQENYTIELAGDAARIGEGLRGSLQEQGLVKPRQEQAGGAEPARDALATGEWLEIDRATIRVGTSDPEAVRPLVKALLDRGHTVRSLIQSRPSLEDLFMQAVQDTQTGQTLTPGAATSKPAGPVARPALEGDGR